MNIITREFSSDQAVFNSVYHKNEYNIKDISIDTVVVDIGGHIGSFALLAHSLGSRNITTFESNQANYAVLLANTMNKDGITAHNKAVRGSYKYTRMGSKSGQNINSQLIKNYGGICVSVGDDVDVITLEDIVSGVGKIDILKLDCEGSEFSIVMDSPPHIFSKIHKIVGELHGCNLDVNKVDGRGITHEEFVAYLRDMGYTVEYTHTSPTSSLGKFTATHE